MSRKSIKEYFKAIYERYQKAPKEAIHIILGRPYSFYDLTTPLKICYFPEASLP